MKCWYCGSSITGNKNKMFCNEHCRYKYNHQADMVLTLKKQWFDMIVSGEKAEEYREIKPYWEKRFLNYFGQRLDLDTKKWAFVSGLCLHLCVYGYMCGMCGMYMK